MKTILFLGLVVASASTLYMVQPAISDEVRPSEHGKELCIMLPNSTEVLTGVVVPDMGVAMLERCPKKTKDTLLRLMLSMYYRTHSDRFEILPQTHAPLVQVEPSRVKVRCAASEAVFFVEGEMGEGGENCVLLRRCQFGDVVRIRTARRLGLEGGYYDEEELGALIIEPGLAQRSGLISSR